MFSTTFTVLGHPVAKGNHRASLRGGIAKIYDIAQAEVERWERQIMLKAQLYAPDHLLLGPVQLDVTFWLPRTREVGKGDKRRTTRCADPCPIKRGTNDADKLARCVGDALTGVIYRDDAQVTDLRARKAFGEPTGAEVTVRELDPDPTQATLF